MPSTSFPLNAWYAAAYDVEVKRALLPRRICDQAMVFYRKEDGGVAALEDACWHRLLPLSLGRLEGDEVVCGYHGLVFNDQGRCTHMPSQETINPAACVRAFPVVERDRFVWVWPGDPALADPALIPDLHWNDDPAWAGDGKLISVKCDYRLVIDNLMDLTHETFVHGVSRSATARWPKRPSSPPTATATATVTRWMEDIDAAAVLGRADPHARGYARQGRPLADHPLRGAVHGGHRRRRRAGAAAARRRATAARASTATCSTRSRPRPSGQLPLLLGLRAQLLPARAAPDARAARRRGGHLPRGRDRARGAAAGDRRAPRLPLLQPQHRRRRDVGAAADRPHGRRRVRSGPRDSRCARR